MISVICPTRLRRQSLDRSLKSLYVGAHDLTGLEVLIAVDPDDVTDYHPWHPIKVNERWGYRELHRYYNLLAARASGQWLLLWNDDALMVTDGWDRIVSEYEPNVILSPSTVHEPLCTFPIVPRRFVQAIGHFSLNTHCDTWWEEIARELDILVWPGIRVEHERADLTGANNDSVYHERQYQTEAFNAMRDTRMSDAAVIRALL